MGQTDRPDDRRAAGSRLPSNSESAVKRNHETPKSGIPKRKKIEACPRLSCKIQYLLASNHRDQSTTSEYFTDDSVVVLASAGTTRAGCPFRQPASNHGSQPQRWLPATNRVEAGAAVGAIGVSGLVILIVRAGSGVVSRVAIIAVVAVIAVIVAVATNAKSADEVAVAMVM